MNTTNTPVSFRLQRVNLPLLAALTPPGHTITIVEEAFAPDDINQDVDLVGITVLTELALRAYRIADAYRQKGVKVVMGGIHPTVLPDEALGACRRGSRGRSGGGLATTCSRMPPRDRCKGSIGPVK